MALNERLRVQERLDAATWLVIDEVANLSKAMRVIMSCRADGASERCMSGYRVVDTEGRVVLLLAPICCRITGARIRSTGESPETSTV